MTRPQRISFFGGLIAIVGAAAFAQIQGPATFDLSWNSVDGGGGISSGGAFDLGGTIGQPDAGGPMSGGGFELTGGFWPGAAAPVLIPCPADITGDQLVNVSDLLAVINSWGACSGCAADVNGDGSVNVTDLLAVINGWGLCPNL